jgi:excinuclease ABC subunit A
MPESINQNKNNIHIKGARVHNLKNFELYIPRNSFIVITGLSGSGKSSLAFDTIYAEGQRRYVESLSSYARQFLGRMQKPDVDFINGIPPAIAIEQKVNSRNPRSSVGTSTEIYDYMKLLFARIGKTYSPVSGKRVKRHTVEKVVDFILGCEKQVRVMILAPVFLPANYSITDYLEILLKQGLTRIVNNGKIMKVSDILEKKPGLKNISDLRVVIDRISVETDEDTKTRVADSVQTAFSIGKGTCIVEAELKGSMITEQFSNKFEADGITFDEPDPHMFSFNNPIGACPLCEGYGKIIGIDEDLVVPNKRLSVYEDALACWRGEKMQKWKQRLILNASKFDFPVHKPYFELSPEQKNLLWTGNQNFKGLNSFFKYLESKKYKIQYRVMLSRYRGKTICPECRGTRLKKEASWVKINHKSIQELVDLPISKLQRFFDSLKLNKHETEIAKRILLEINSRIRFMVQVGLGYLTLNRLSSTLSGGESQRINLATSLGSSLVGSLYILDEPSIGLHPKDTTRLIQVLQSLKKIGNTVMVVEHDEDIIRAADQIIDIGPFAGRLGGEIIFQGDHKQLLRDTKSLTAMYLTGKKIIEVPKIRRKSQNKIIIHGAREHNLKNITLKIPLNIIAVITGVSGSGKSTLVRNILYPALTKILFGYGEKTGDFDTLSGDINQIEHVEFVNQNPIGKSSRSNPVTYLKAWDEIRKLYAEQPFSIINHFKASHFSFNIDGGRCEECQGEGIIKVGMQFMADVELVCESCKGRRFKDEILEVKYNGKNVYDILELTVNEAIEFFSQQDNSLAKKITKKLKPLADVGLGYIKLGQSSSTLSGGESQRVKLAYFLSKETGNFQHHLFIFDEPTTGLHFHDIRRLLDAFQKLIERGNSIIIIEHNLEIIKSADWVIDLGPGGGEEGGEIVAQGTPEEITNNKLSYTGRYLKPKLIQ